MKGTRKELIFMIIIKIIFAILFIIGIINLRRGISTFGIGIPIDVENWMVIVLSFLGVVKYFTHIAKH